MRSLVRRPPTASELVAVAVVVIAVVLTFLATSRPAAALSITVVALGLALFAHRPVLVAVLAVPAQVAAGPLLGGLIGPGDAALAVASALAIPALIVLGDRGALRVALVLTAPYACTLMLSLAAHPSALAALELLQRTVLVLGAIMVGVWIAREEVAHLALRLLVAVAVALAVTAILGWLASGFEPAFPWGLHKNFAGAFLAVTFVVALATPEHTVRGVARLVVLVTLAVGLVATESRGAMYGAALGATTWLVLSRREVRRRWALVAVAGVLTLGAVTYASVTQQLASAARVTDNSIEERREVHAATVQAWEANPWTGSGIGFWRTQAGGRAPVNMAFESLAEGGVFAGLGLVVMVVGLLVVLARRRRADLAVAAAAALVVRVAHGNVDIFWSAGATGLVFILVGIGLACEVPAPAQWAARRPRRLGRGSAETPWSDGSGTRVGATALRPARLS